MRTVIFRVVFTIAIVAIAGSCAPKLPVPTPVRPQPEMIRIPGGEYAIGSDSGEVNEQPRHIVVAEPFYIDKYEVTNAQYLEFVRDTGYPPPPRWRPDGTFWPEDADLPVTWVSWHDAQAFARWRGVRLPTEAEWEIAARCTTDNRYPWGDSLITGEPPPLNVAGVRDTSLLGPAPVHSYPEGASCWGVLNLAGNVWEWVGDWYHPAAYQHRAPHGPATVSSDSLLNQRAIRGGSWLDPISSARTTSRRGLEPSARSDIVGFRCARDAK